MSDIQKQIEFNEIWWNNVQEGEPIAQDEIDEVKSLIASLKLAVKALETELKAAKTWDRHGTVKHIEGTLSEINRLSGGNET